MPYCDAQGRPDPNGAYEIAPRKLRDGEYIGWELALMDSRARSPNSVFLTDQQKPAAHDWARQVRDAARDARYLPQPAPILTETPSALSTDRVMSAAEVRDYVRDHRHAA